MALELAGGAAEILAPTLVGVRQEGHTQLAEGRVNATKGGEEDAHKVSLAQKEFTII